jgi:hypothetical protein
MTNLEACWRTGYGGAIIRTIIEVYSSKWEITPFFDEVGSWKGRKRFNIWFLFY